MNEIQKAAAGLLYDANFDPEILKMRLKTKQTLFEFNQTPPEKQEERNSILKSLFGKLAAVL
ncbi:maltose acetyltransferase domain-containing protein [Acinetobacter chinensis]|uniref:maltose acetyltransferase domain-containing protein n=1 Tax=Acinetobacter chinensis TaxID=2004650 RepID=UPI00293502B7|nr:maltose acetyltransferase domain-containing protein [Acinetobacter chinensis]WOE42850.1 maltose acetyltransferase domain-containing protein [Acinetobacter chinensis]